MLIDTEKRRLDASVMEAEDAAIWAAEHPGSKEPIPQGEDLADLIERLSHDATTPPLHEG